MLGSSTRSTQLQGGARSCRGHRVIQEGKRGVSAPRREPDVAQQERRLDDQRIGVGFGEGAEVEAATDARKRHDDSVGASDS